ncbi:MAG TPA: ankyrin repeat domain-containing protein [Planctomycetota bacterium]|jgi:cytohesin
MPADPEFLKAILLAAVKGGGLEKVKELVAHDPNVVHAFTPEGLSALQLAAEQISWDHPKHAEIARFLLENGARCDIFTAARAGFLDAVKKLLGEQPSLLNAADATGRTPLQRAALTPSPSADCEAVADFLILSGADIDIFTACAFGIIERVERLLKADPNLVKARCQGGTPLHWAARPQRNPAAASSICAILLRAGAQIEAADLELNGMSALHHAAQWGSPVEVLDLLLAAGADLQDRDNLGWTALDHATQNSHAASADFLRSRGAVPAPVRIKGNPGLRAREAIEAAQRGDVPTLGQLLRENPALVNARGECGETPLHWAAHNGHLAAVELLVSSGADLHAQATQKWGGTPLFWAAEQHVEIAAFLLDKGAAVDAINAKNGQTPLHACARSGDCAPMAELLLARGAAVNAQDNSGTTPLSYAFQLGHVHVADVLRKNKARE